MKVVSMASAEHVSTEISALKKKVKEIIADVNALKSQLEKREISLEEFKSKKEILENELRGILEKISQYKEKGTKETKHDAFIAEEAKRLMFEFQTEFSDYISKPKVYLSASLIDHFIFEVDFTNYPNKPLLRTPDSLQKLFTVPFETKLSTLNNWSPQNPPHITEIFYEIENIFAKIFQSENLNEPDLNLRYARKVLQRWKLLTAAEFEKEIQNFPKAIELYQQVVQLSYDLEDFEQANKYARIIAQLKKN